MALIRTTAGPLDPELITGPVLIHEHLQLDLRTGDDQAATLGTAEIDHIVEEIDFSRRTDGLSLVVDLTCRGMGRSIRGLQTVSARTGVPVVAATGYYYEAFHPAEVSSRSLEQLTDLLTDEIRVGVTDEGKATGVRPGVLGEIGSHGLRPSPAEELSFRAAGLAALSTGLSVATHAHLGRGGRRQLELLLETGLPAHRVSLGHQDLLDDPAEHAQLASKGAYIAFDTVGKESYQSDDVRLRLIMALLEAGHGERILLSNDVSRHGYLHSEGGTGYRHVLSTFAQRLSQRGVDTNTLRLLYHDNPLRFLTAGGPDEAAKKQVQLAGALDE